MALDQVYMPIQTMVLKRRRPYISLIAEDIAASQIGSMCVPSELLRYLAHIRITAKRGGDVGRVERRLGIDLTETERQVCYPPLIEAQILSFLCSSQAS